MMKLFRVSSRCSHIVRVGASFGKMFKRWCRNGTRSIKITVSLIVAQDQPGVALDHTPYHPKQ